MKITFTPPKFLSKLLIKKKSKKGYSPKFKLRISPTLILSIVMIFCIVLAVLYIRHLAKEDSMLLQYREFYENQDEMLNQQPVLSATSALFVDADNKITHNYIVEIADTPETREQGLSGRDTLTQGHGMLFVFDSAMTDPFWMKDTLITLDMVFIDENNVIVDIAPNMQPCAENSECQKYTPTSAYKYVLEVNADESKYVSIGNRMEIKE